MQLPVNNKAIYHTWILVTLWVLQFIAEIIVIAYGGICTGLYSAILAYYNKYYSNGTWNCSTDSDGNTVCNGDTSNFNGVNITTSNVSSWIGLFLGVSVMTLVIGLIFFITHIVQVVFYAKRRLTPKGNFGFDCSRFVLWTIIFILNIAAVAAARGAGSILLLVFSALVEILYLLSIIYASILFHRMRKGAYDNLAPGQAKAGSGDIHKAEGGYGYQGQSAYQGVPQGVPNPPAARYNH